MKKLRFIIALTAMAVIGACSAARAQTNIITGTTTNAAVAPADFLPSGNVSQALTMLLAAVDNSDIVQATNWALVPYMTYAPDAADHVGAGFLAIYNIPQLSGDLGRVGGALGMDWLGSWSLVSANVTVQTDTHPLAHISWLTFLPTSVTNITVTPFGIAGVGTPMSGGGSAATIWDVGAEIKFGHLWGGQFGVGGTYGAWSGAGKESGRRDHLFVAWQKGF